jgi:hypothetical protein
MYLFIFRLPLVLEIFFDYFLIGILSYCVYVISTCPKFSAAEQPFYFWMKPENFLCGNALDRSYYPFWSVRRNALNQKMNMVAIKPNFQKMDFISLLYVKTNFFECDRNITGQNLSPIFDRSNKMTQKQTFVMAFMDMFTHIHKYKYLYATPEAVPRGILMIKDQSK